MFDSLHPLEGTASVAKVETAESHEAAVVVAAEAE
jgi:hypothetical protein